MSDKSSVLRYSTSRRAVLALLAGLAILGVVAGAVSAAPGLTTRVSVSSAGIQGDNHSTSGGISENGRYIVFNSPSTTLAPNDTDAINDVFVRDLQTQTTTLVSVSSSGVKGNGGSRASAISGGGRYVVFDSGATNLVPNDTNAQRDIFLHDRDTGKTERVSVSSSGAEANSESFALAGSVSTDGRFVVFYSRASNLGNDRNGGWDVFVRDRQAGTTRLVSATRSGGPANGASLTPHISADGRFVTFMSHATNLVNKDNNGAVSDVFVHDLQTAATKLVSVSSSGVQGTSTSFLPAINADGRFVAFTSSASNLVAGDTNAAYDVFVRDLQAGTTERVSVSSAGEQGQNPPNVGIPADSSHPYLSADGRFVAFRSLASNLVPGDTNYTDPQRSLINDVFVRDRVAGTTVRASVSSSGEQANGTSEHPSISADGLRVAFDSSATNLVPGDINGVRFDVFLHELGAPPPPPPDTTPPETTITSGPSGEVASTTATFEFASSESPSSFECSLDGAPFDACSSPKTYTGLAPGSHSFNVRAIDAAGNTDSTPAQRTWNVLACTIVGTEGADRLTGTSGDDIICTLGGNDEVVGEGGDDTVLGGSGDDKLFGGIGADTLRGGAGRDELNGEDGNDSLLGEEDFDKLNGGLGTDSCDVGPDGGESVNCE